MSNSLGYIGHSQTLTGVVVSNAITFETDNGHSISLTAPTAATSDYTLKLPSTGPTAINQVPAVTDIVTGASEWASMVASSTSGSSTDNAIVRWDETTGTAAQDSLVVIDDEGAITGVKTFNGLSISGDEDEEGKFASGTKLIIGSAVDANLVGDSNTLIGRLVGSSGSLSGTNNTCVGSLAGYELTGGAYNVCIGSNAAPGLVTGNYNTMIGHASDVQPGSNTNSTAIGYGATSTEDNEVVLGNNDIRVIRPMSEGKTDIGSEAFPIKDIVWSGTLINRQFKTIATATDTGNQGTVAFDRDYMYVCTGRDEWKRVALSTW